MENGSGKQEEKEEKRERRRMHVKSFGRVINGGLGGNRKPRNEEMGNLQKENRG